MRKVIYFLAALALSVAPLSALNLANEDLSTVPGKVMNETPPQTESTGWIDMGRYKELKAHNAGVASLRVTEDGKRIISVTKNEFKVWDAETADLINEYKVPISELDSLIILDDNRVIAVKMIYRKDQDDHYRNYQIEFTIYDVNNDMVTNKFTTDSEELPSKTASRIRPVNFEIKPARESNTLFYSAVLWTIQSSNTQAMAWYVGTLGKAALKGDTAEVTKIGNQSISKFLFINTDDIAAISEVWSATCHPVSNAVVFLHYLTKLVVSKEDLVSTNDIHEGISEGYFTSTHIKTPLITNLKLLAAKKILVECLDDSLFYFRNLDDYHVNDSCIFQVRTPSYEFSFNGNFFITGYNNGIYIYSAPQLTETDSYAFDSKNYNWKFAVFPDSVSFATGSSDGYLRLFRSEALKGGPVSADDPTDREKLGFIYPNPAANELFLQKNEALLGSRVEIYSPTGVKAFEVPYSQRIDISALPAGMYFIKVGGEYSKFIKK
ncbi:MAG: T9SS type A sorting domain-containing protein [Chloroflexota bacterium]